MGIAELMLFECVSLCVQMDTYIMPPLHKLQTQFPMNAYIAAYRMKIFQCCVTACLPQVTKKISY